MGAGEQSNCIVGAVAAVAGIAVAGGLPCSADYVYHVPYFLADGDERRHSVLRVGCNRCYYFFDFEIIGAHVEGSATVAAYARDDLVEKRRPVMQRWATACQDSGYFGATSMTVKDPGCDLTTSRQNASY